MNYYEHHLGDYDGATAHLTWMEDCAYRRLLCLYYRTESPLPADAKQICRLSRAVSKAERDAVQQVLEEFFDLRDDGWHNDRCDEDIAAFHDTEPEREAKRENAKERQRRSRERRRQLFDALRGHDIVPAWDTSTKQLEHMLAKAEGVAGDAPVTGSVTPPVTQPVTAPVTPVTCDDTATHTPDPPPTSHLPPPSPKPVEGGTRAARPPDRPASVTEQTWTDWLALRRAKKAPVTPTVLADAEREARKAGMTLDAFLAEWCSRGSQGLKADWIQQPGRAGPQPVNRQLALEAENRRVLAQVLRETP